MSDISIRELHYIRWEDSVGCSSSWCEIPDRSPEPHICHTVGWVIAENANCVVIAPHISPASDELQKDTHACGDMAIPKRSIVQRIVIDLDKITASHIGAANFMRGMSFDPSVPSEQKQALTGKAREIEAVVEKHLDQ